jgi:serine O-acetyltransferase
VIGETAQIGDDCTLYHGVTLGGRAPQRGEFGQKRHPTLGNGVIVSSGAQVLGPFRVGDGARVAAAAVVLSEVPDGVTVVGVPARPVGNRRSERPATPAFDAYGIPPGGLPDPVARALDGLLGEVTSLRARLAACEENQRPPVDERIDRPVAASAGGNGAAKKP